MALWIDRRKAIRHRPGITTKAEEKILRANATAMQEGNADPMLDVFDTIPGFAPEPAKKEIGSNEPKESKTPMDKGKTDDDKKEK